jgi:hypothetical protein
MKSYANTWGPCSSSSNRRGATSADMWARFRNHPTASEALSWFFTLPVPRLILVIPTASEMFPKASTPRCRCSTPHPVVATPREGGRTRRSRCTDLDHVVASLLRFAPTLLSLVGSNAAVVRETSNTTLSCPRRVLNPLIPSSLYRRCRDMPWAQVCVRRLLLPPPADLSWARRWLLLPASERGR